MSTATIFTIQLVLGYIPWLLFLGAYVWPRLKVMDRVDVQRAIATLHSFRFFGLVFLVPGVVGPNLPKCHNECVPGVRYAESTEALVASTHRVGPALAQIHCSTTSVGTTLLLRSRQLATKDPCRALDRRVAALRSADGRRHQFATGVCPTSRR